MNASIEYSKEEKIKIAKERIAEERSFYSHLTVYLIVVTGLSVLNLFQGGYFWAKWVMLGWGIGLFSHAAGAFGFPRLLGKKWEARRMEQLMNDKQ